MRDVPAAVHRTRTRIGRDLVGCVSDWNCSYQQCPSSSIVPNPRQRLGFTQLAPPLAKKPRLRPAVNQSFGLARWSGALPRPTQWSVVEEDSWRSLSSTGLVADVFSAAVVQGNW